MPPLSFAYLLRALRKSAHWHRLHVRAALWALLVVILVLLGGSWLIVPVEASAPHANITSFPRALWWSVETATTVGYGDFFPVTAGGRTIASVVMLAGISAFSVVTAAIATWFVGGAARRVRQLARTAGKFEEEGKSDVSEEMRALHARFDRLEHLLGESRRPPESR